MTLNYSFVFLLIWTGLSFYSCVEDENNAVQIKFAKVVGRYSGESKLCKPINFTLDTTCSFGVLNLIKVILFDNNSIIVEDELGIYSKSRLIKTADTIILNEKHYVFDSPETTKKFRLIFFETAGVIKMTNQVSNGSQTLVDFFEGKKQ